MLSDKSVSIRCLLLLAPLVLACATRSAEAPAAEPLIDVADAAVAEEPLTDCAGLDELACIDSVDCTLRQNEDKSYACTAPESDCERGFAQRAGGEADCAAGCAFSPAQCYCSPDVTCVCSGGPPALCQAIG